MECEHGLNGGSYAVCSRSYHAKCAGMTKVPEGEFVCPKHSNDASSSEDVGSVYKESESASSSSSDESSNSEFSSDQDLGAFVERHQKVFQLVLCYCYLRPIVTLFVSRPEEPKSPLKQLHIWEAAVVMRFRIMNLYLMQVSL
jgi:hypothetical protein